MRSPLFNPSRFEVVALAALLGAAGGILGVGVVGLVAPTPFATVDTRLSPVAPALPGTSLVFVDGQGEAYVLDHGMTAEDCAAALPGAPAGSACELESN